MVNNNFNYNFDCAYTYIVYYYMYMYVFEILTLKTNVVDNVHQRTQPLLTYGTLEYF